MVEKKGYRQFCPVALAAEVVAERWTPLVVRELLMGSTRFNDLQRGLPRMSSALLSQRLKELQFAGIVERRAAGNGTWEYHLTEAGRELEPLVATMGGWAQRWLSHKITEPANLDPNLLMWDIRRSVTPASPTDPRLVVAFHLSGVPVANRRYWLVFHRGVVDVCHKDPGHEPDMILTTSLSTLTSVWMGHVPLGPALRSGQVQLDGPPALVKDFPRWFRLSSLAIAAE